MPLINYYTEVEKTSYLTICIESSSIDVPLKSIRKQRDSFTQASTYFARAFNNLS